MRTLARLLGIALVLFVPPSAAYWETPAGVPYLAQHTILEEEPSQRTQLQFASRMIVWAERRWDEYEWTGSPGQVTIYEFNPDDPAETPAVTRPTSSNRSTELDATERFAVWIQDDGLMAYDRVSRQTTVIARENAPRSPHVNGDFLVWAQQGTQPSGWGWWIYRLNLTARFAPPQSAGPNMPPIPPEPAFGFRAPGCSPPMAWPADNRVLVFTPPGCLDDDHTGLQLYDPWTEKWSSIDRGDIVMADVQGARVVYAAVREGSTNLYLADLDPGLQRRITWSQGREAYPSLSGDLVAWADIRSRSREYRDGMPAYDVYFQNVLTLNEYKLEDSWAFTAGPALSGNRLVYNDYEGRLVMADLPPASSLLDVHVLVEVVDGPLKTLQLSIEGTQPVEAYWHTDTDGDVDKQGTLTIPFETAEGSNKAVVGVGVDEQGRTVAVGFELHEAAAFASSNAGPALFRVARATPDDQTNALPIPSMPASTVAVTLLLAFAVLAHGRRPTS